MAMAAARAQAIGGLGVNVRNVRARRIGGDAQQEEYEGPPPRIYTSLDAESPTKWLYRTLQRALWTQESLWLVAGAVVVLDAALTFIIILAVRYTEIDYTAYMQQARIFLNGERKYNRLIGGTGPCVYPALHVYVFSALSYLSNGSKNLFPVQLVFGIVYLVTEVAAMAMYKAAGVPPIILPILAASKRLHSIFVLRLFNDCWAVMFMYLGIWAMCRGSWRTASVLYSLALGVKMNILLYAPAMAAIYLRALGLQRSVIEALRVLLIQALLALPFLLQDPRAYLSSAFDLSREFLYKWTVNWRFINESTFLDKGFARGLLAVHATIVAAFLLYRWTDIGRGGVKWLQEQTSKKSPKNASRPSERYIVLALATSNLIGVTCARSLHYQFFSWYAHQIPLLVYFAALPRVVKYALPLCIEIAWNTYPSTQTSSRMLLGAHIVLLAGLWRARFDDASLDNERTQEEQQRLRSLYENYEDPALAKPKQEKAGQGT